MAARGGRFRSTQPGELNMIKHTPGPWAINGADIVACPSVKWHVIAKVEHLGYDAAEAERSANARLIAAAPRLVEALNKAGSEIAAVAARLANYDGCDRQLRRFLDSVGGDADDAFETIRAALAAACGE
jgi:hypothetical protein